MDTLKAIDAIQSALDVIDGSHLSGGVINRIRMHLVQAKEYLSESRVAVTSRDGRIKIYVPAHRRQDARSICSDLYTGV